MEHQISQKVFVTYTNDKVIIKRVKPTLVTLEVPRAVVDYVFSNIKKFVERSFDGKDRIDMQTPDPHWSLSKYYFMKKVMFSWETTVMDIDKPLNSISVGFSDMSTWKQYHVEYMMAAIDINNNNVPAAAAAVAGPSSPPPSDTKRLSPTAKSLYVDILKKNLAAVIAANVANGDLSRPGPSSIPTPSPSIPSPQFKVPQVQPLKKRKTPPSEARMDSLDPIGLIMDDHESDEDDDIIVDHVKLSYSGDDEMDVNEEVKEIKKSKKKAPKRKYTKKN